MIGRAGRP
jgi:activating signal cointegrator complex subunit 3